jgi:hypothetical protein
VNIFGLNFSSQNHAREPAFSQRLMHKFSVALNQIFRYNKKNSKVIQLCTAFIVIMNLIYTSGGFK